VRTLDAPTMSSGQWKAARRTSRAQSDAWIPRYQARPHNTEHFELEVRAFKELIKRGYNNLGIMIPLVQHPTELRRAKEFMRKNGLT